MTLEEVEKIISEKQQQLSLVPQIQRELDRALGYRQHILEQEKEKEDESSEDTS